MTAKSQAIRLPRWLRDEIAYHVTNWQYDAVVNGDESRALLGETVLTYLSAGPAILPQGVLDVIAREAANIADIMDDSGKTAKANVARSVVEALKA